MYARNVIYIATVLLIPKMIRTLFLFIIFFQNQCAQHSLLDSNIGFVVIFNLIKKYKKFSWYFNIIENLEKSKLMGSSNLIRFMKDLRSEGHLYTIIIPSLNEHKILKIKLKKPGFDAVQ